MKDMNVSLFVTSRSIRRCPGMPLWRLILTQPLSLFLFYLAARSEYVNYYFPFPDFPLFLVDFSLCCTHKKKTLNTSHVKNIEANVKSFQVYNLWVMPIPKL